MKKIYNYFIGLMVLLLCLGLAAFDNSKESSGRVTALFNDGWKFSKLADGVVLNSTNIDTAKWEEVTLPHTWNNIDGCDGYANTVVESDGTTGVKDRKENSYYRGLGGYVKEYIFTSDVYGGKKVFIEFEGANTITTLYVNGTKIGKPHKGGYAAFRYDITDYIVLDKINVIAVTVDNSRTTDVAPLDWEGDYTKFGGIYRDVSIVAVDRVHIDLMDYGSDGVYISTQKVTTKSADTHIKVNITNDSSEVQNVTVEVALSDASGKTAASKNTTVELKSNHTSPISFDIPIKKPHLWNGVKNPSLYTCKVSVTSGSYSDTKTVTYGYRYFSISNDKGFLLNGKKYNIYGVNYHQDSYENGWAMTDAQRDRDYQIMQEMGVTAVRMAHYQHDAYEYDICDKKGLIVYTEIPLINRATINKETVPSKAFSDNIKQQLMEIIKQNYNHPSVVFWGISNELYDISGETTKLYNELCDIADKEDPFRITIYADNVVNNSTRKRSAQAEAVGYNRYDGWYYTTLGNLSKWISDTLKADSRPACISEYGAGGAVSQHKDNIVKKDIKVNGSPHYEEYESIYHEISWADISSSKIWGSFIWCMFDFASDARVEGDTQGQNDKGLVTRDRKTYKDAFYFYKSVWNSENMVYITDKRYTERNQSIPEVKVYSNALKVELFVNGKSYGVIKQSSLAKNYRTIYRWKDIKLNMGIENEIKAVATYGDGKSGIDTAKWSVK